MKNEIVVEELNTLLRGTYMGIRTLEHYIQELEPSELRQYFQSMQQEVKESAAKLAARIQDLGGMPADDEGFTGSMHSFMHNMMLPHEPNKMIEDALESIHNYGIGYSEEVVRGDLDETSKQVVTEVLNTNRKHVDILRQLLH